MKKIKRFLPEPSEEVAVASDSREARLAKMSDQELAAHLDAVHVRAEESYAIWNESNSERWAIKTEIVERFARKHATDPS